MSDRPPQALPALPGVKLGLWRHYKGGTYRVLGVVRHSETLEPMVLYKPDPPCNTRVRIVLPWGAGQFLMELMDNPRYPGTLGKTRFPGGGVNPGETLKEAVIREAAEEFQLDLSEAWMVYLGTPHGDPYGEHYFLVPVHRGTVGTFTDADGEHPITLVRGDWYEDRYMGADLRAVRLPGQPAGVVGDAWTRPLSMWEEDIGGVNTPVKRFTFLRD
jgi:8-oxo-dGTP pyrophosphatase MutT (NUDIX family)